MSTIKFWMLTMTSLSHFACLGLTVDCLFLEVWSVDSVQEEVVVCVFFVLSEPLHKKISHVNLLPFLVEMEIF